MRIEAVSRKLNTFIRRMAWCHCSRRRRSKCALPSLDKPRLGNISSDSHRLRHPPTTPQFPIYDRKMQDACTRTTRLGNSSTLHGLARQFMPATAAAGIEPLTWMVAWSGARRDGRDQSAYRHLTSPSLPHGEQPSSVPRAWLTPSRRAVRSGQEIYHRSWLFKRRNVCKTPPQHGSREFHGAPRVLDPAAPALYCSTTAIFFHPQGKHHRLHARRPRVYLGGRRVVQSCPLSGLQ
jgi:hypothetical protein